MRPKSMATVVVALLGTAARSSTPSDSLVTSASVRSGMISETEPTRVVLPTPKPPATTIFVEAAALRPAFVAGLVAAKSTECPFDQVKTFIGAGVLGDGRLDAEEALLDEVAEQDPRDADRHLHQGRHLGHGAAVADPEDPLRLRV